MSKENFYETIVEDVQADFSRRQQERKGFEAQWQLNNNFLVGNQYCSINLMNEIEDYDKQYFWQEREVFNHIAPLVEARMSRLVKINPKMSVLPVSGEEMDMRSARITKDILNSVYSKLNLHEVIETATQWSEICGTSFYKVLWNSDAGRVVCKNENGGDVKEGEIEVVAIPPYEIFPDNSSCEDINDCSSIIHAKAYHVDVIKNIWGVDVEGGDVDVFSLKKTQTTGGLGYNGVVGKVANSVKSQHSIVIEKYEMPTINYPNGRLIVVCEDKLLYIGELPYINGIDGERVFPFVKQVSNRVPGCFWGNSIIERLIPVQRAYNAVKNRKHEFLNRVSMGVMTVEDGSVDIDNLEEEGLSPGKVLVYRQGSNPPSMMQADTVPADFIKEEERLLIEFSEIGGVSDIMTNTSRLSQNISGTALQLMIEQDDTRLLATSESIKNAVKNVAKHIVRLYKQFAVLPKICRTMNVGGDGEIYFWSNADLSSDEIEFETEEQLGDSLSQKRSFIMELLSTGLLDDDDAKMAKSTKLKVLQMLGFGVWDEKSDVATLQKRYADDENLELVKSGKSVDVQEIDNHQIHIDSHISFMLDKNFAKLCKKSAQVKNRFLSHIKLHKQMQKEEEKDGR